MKLLAEIAPKNFSVKAYSHVINYCNTIAIKIIVDNTDFNCLCLFFLVFGSSSIFSFSVWLYNCSIGSRIEGSVEIKGLVKAETLPEGFKSFAVGFTGSLNDF